ncbi:MAG: formate dehydrogenase subunit delta [Hyphomicrobiaceae bacterium]
MQQRDKLVMMANQIAKFFEPQGEARAVPQIAKHIEDFWDPRMRRGILEHVASGGAGLDPLALAAIKKLRPVPQPDAGHRA